MARIQRQFLLFAGVGALGTAVQYLILVLLVELAGLGPTVASAWGFAAGAVVNYALNRQITFASDRSHLVALPRFVSVAIAGAILNSAIVHYATQQLGIHYLLAQVVATAVVLLCNFTAHRLWTFAEPRARAQE